MASRDFKTEAHSQHCRPISIHQIPLLLRSSTRNHMVYIFFLHTRFEMADAGPMNSITFFRTTWQHIGPRRGEMITTTSYSLHNIPSQGDTSLLNFFVIPISRIKLWSLPISFLFLFCSDALLQALRLLFFTGLLQKSCG